VYIADPGLACRLPGNESVRVRLRRAIFVRADTSKPADNEALVEGRFPKVPGDEVEFIALPE
jgi:hypothetical protein